VVRAFRTVTLEVTPRIAEKIAVAQTIGTLSLSLRSIADNQSELDRAIAAGDIECPKAPPARRRSASCARRSPAAGRRHDLRDRRRRVALPAPLHAGPGQKRQRSGRHAVPVAQSPPARPAGPTVRVTRGKATTEVPVAKGAGAAARPSGAGGIDMTMPRTAHHAAVNDPPIRTNARRIPFEGQDNEEPPSQDRADRRLRARAAGRDPHRYGPVGRPQPGAGYRPVDRPRRTGQPCPATWRHLRRQREVADVQVKSQRQLYVFGKAGGETTVYASNAAGDIIWSANVRVGSNIDSVDQMLAWPCPRPRSSRHDGHQHRAADRHRRRARKTRPRLSASYRLRRR
jgi:hypothetical protein